MINMRCAWVDESWELDVQYHDHEWGVPVYDDGLLFEMLVLESFQAGLSWAIIMKKREGYRKAFDKFNPVAIANYTEKNVEGLMQDSGVVRSRGKIMAAINNAKVFLRLQKEYGSFSNYIWSFTDNHVVRNIKELYYSKTELSEKVSKDMKKHGIKFMGPATTNAYLMAVGIINGHDPTCFKTR